MLRSTRAAATGPAPVLRPLASSLFALVILLAAGGVEAQVVREPVAGSSGEAAEAPVVRDGYRAESAEEKEEERARYDMWKVEEREIDERYASLPTLSDLIQIRFPGARFTCTPLYVLDGVPTASADVLGLKPTLVTAVELLRHDTETAIYGFRGACGVVVVTLRR